MVTFGNDWDIFLKDEFTKPYYMALRSFLKQEYSNYTVYPNMHNIFTALKLTPPDNTKVVILGQDPYHGPNQAHGLAFSVKKGQPLPPSLQNIFKEIASELGHYIPNNGYLEKWARQGVLLLNATLSVRAHQPNSHKGRGWEQFTDNIIKILSDQRKGIIFLLWGANAAAKESLIDKARHHVLKAPHPSPLSAFRGFFGCGHFKRANELLISQNKQPIDWQIENI